MQGNRIKKLRKEKGYSLNKFSELTGISKSYISFLERGIQKNPSLDVLEKIASVLDVEIDYLVKKGNSPPVEEKPTEKSVIKVEIEISQEQLDPAKLDQIKELINMFNKEKT